MKNERIYTSRFWLLSFSAFLFVISFKMLVPILTQVVEYYGGSWQKALVITLFAAAALIARPFSGTLVDIVGRKPIMIFGTAVCAVLGLCYTLVDGLLLFLILRFFHGFSAGFAPIGNTSYLADISPVHRRGEAMGVMGMMTSLGFALGPQLGSIISSNFGWDVLYLSSTGVAIISILMIMKLPESKLETTRMKLQDLAIKKEALFDRKVIIPFFIMILSIMPFGVASTSIFKQARMIGFEPEWESVFFLVAASTSITVRFLAGKASDIYGRRNVLFTGIFIMLVSLLILAFAETKESFIVASVIYGVSIGINSPTIFAWTMDLADPNRIGRAMSTLFIAVEIGVIVGSVVSGLLMDLPNNAYTIIHLFGVGICALALTILIFTKRDRPPSLQ